MKLLLLTFQNYRKNLEQLPSISTKTSWVRKEGHCEYITFIQLHEDRIEIIDPWSGEVIKNVHDFSGDVEKRKNKKKSGDNQ